MKRILLLVFLFIGFNSYGQTATTIKTAIDGTITNKTDANSISPTTVGTRMKEVVDFADRGVKVSDSATKYVTPKRLADTAAAIRDLILSNVGSSFKPKAERWVSQIAGVPLDGSAPITPYVQPVLDSADILGGLHLHWDVAINEADSEARVKSNTTIEGVGMPYMRLGGSVRQPFFINYNAHATNQIDSNIVIKNFYLDGNAFNNIDSVLGYVTRDNSITCGMLFAGVKGLVLDNITFYQTNAWGVALCNVDYSYLSNLTGIRDYSQLSLIEIPGTNWRLGKVPLSMDLLNYRGGCEFGYWENLKSNSPDDAVAFNNIEYSSSLGGQEYFNFDPIHDIYGYNLQLDSAALGIVVYSTTSPIYNIGADNIHGTVQYRWGAISSNSNAAAAIVGYDKGDTKNVTFSNIDVELIKPLPNTFDYTAGINSDEMFCIDGNVENLTLTNPAMRSQDRYLATLRQRDGFYANQVTINNPVDIHTKDTAVASARYVFEGRANKVTFNSPMYTRYGVAQGGTYASIDSANVIAFNNFNAYNVAGMVTTSGLGVKKIVVDGVICDSCSTSGAAVTVTSTSATVKLSADGVNVGAMPFLGGAGASNLMTNGGFFNNVYGLQKYQHYAGDTVSNAWLVQSYLGSHWYIPTTGVYEKGWAWRDGSDGTVRGALGVYYNAGYIGAWLGGGTYSTGTIKIEKPTSQANILSFWANNSTTINRTSSSNYVFDINGRTLVDATFRVTGDSIYQVNTKNGTVSNYVHNPSNGASSQAQFNAISDLSSCTFGKYSTGHTTYKIISANSGFFYNSNGAFALLNDGTNITMASNGSSTAQFTLSNTGLTLTGRLQSTAATFTTVSEYADNAAALAGGLTAGMIYRTGDLLKIVH